MTRETPPLCAAAFRFPLGRRGLLPAVVISVGVALIVGSAAFPTTAQAKSPGSKYCFHGYCHRVGTLSQTDTLVGWRGYVLASYYDSCRRDRLNPCGLTSSGAVSLRAEILRPLLRSRRLEGIERCDQAVSHAEVDQVYV